MYQIPACSNSSRHIPNLEPLCPITWGCSQHRDSPGETSPVLVSPLPSSTSAAFPKHAPSPQQIISSNSFKRMYVWGAFLLEYGKQPNQDAVQCWALSRMNIPCTANVQALLEVYSPHSDVSSQKEPSFPSISHLTQGLYWIAHGFTKGITWNACGRCVNEDSRPCGYSLNFNGNEPQTTDASLQYSARGQSIKADFLYF